MLTISHAQPQDIEFISEIHAFCWRETYSFMPAKVLQDRNQRYRKQQWDQWFAAPEKGDALFTIRSDGKIVGFCFCCKNKDYDLFPATGELHAAYVLPQYRGGGLWGH